MHWAMFLHWYQPHGQNREILSLVVKESYKPILGLLKKNPEARVSINIIGCLADQLGYFYPEVLDDLKLLIERGQIELVASANHHAFLPLIPEIEIERQIEMGMAANRRAFGKLYNPRGFFPTELGYSNSVLSAVLRFGFNYLLVDEYSVKEKIGELDWSKKYNIGNLNLVPVNRQWSATLRGNMDWEVYDMYDAIKEWMRKEVVLVTANDVELFGHHATDRLDLLKLVIADKEVGMITLSEYLNFELKKENVRRLYKGTWETESKDLGPYPLWHSKDNLIQKRQWRLANLAIDVMDKFVQPKKDPGWKWHGARDNLDAGLGSCYWWWASCRPWWNPDMIIKGANLLVKSVRSTNAKNELKMDAERLFLLIQELVWKWHWEGEAQSRVDEFEKKIGKGLYWVRTQPPAW